MDSIMVKIIITPAILGICYFFVPTTRYLEDFGWKKQKHLAISDGRKSLDRHFVGGKDTKRFNGSGKGNEPRMKMVLWFICCNCYTFDLHKNYFDPN